MTTHRLVHVKEDLAMSFAEKMKLFFSKVWDFLYPFVKVFLSQAGSVLASAAIAAVKIVAETHKDADGDTKRKAAFNLIKDDLAAKGITLASSFIFSAIEAAVQKLKLEGE
jgi:hypothetical protein